MNYYNNPYYSPYAQQNQFPPNIPMQQPQQPIQQQQQMQVPALNGKMVDSIEMVKATEVPIGGYGVFPKGDLSEIYIKSWNSNGTTTIQTFQPVMIPQPQDINTVELIKKIEELEKRIAEIEGKRTVVRRGVADDF